MSAVTSAATARPRADQGGFPVRGQETRWCPGCGDYAVLSAVQSSCRNSGPPERIVFISGIGCAGRFAYYMNTYGMHGIHGRAPAIATGLAAAHDDLSVWVVGGDGDALSIGGNHLIHALRRNVPIKILLLNNQIYGLTKGQARRPSELGKVTKSTPYGSLDRRSIPSRWRSVPGRPSSRARSTRQQHMTSDAARGREHPGAALVEIYQNCPVFNDGAFVALTEKETRDVNADPSSSTDSRSASAPTASSASVRSDGGSWRSPRWPRSASDALICPRRRTARTPGLAFALSRLATGRRTHADRDLPRRAPDRPRDTPRRRAERGARAFRRGGAVQAAARRRHLVGRRLIGRRRWRSTPRRSDAYSSRTPTPSGGRRSASTPAPLAKPTRSTSTSKPLAPPGTRTSLRRRCSRSSTPSRDRRGAEGPCRRHRLRDARPWRTGVRMGAARARRRGDRDTGLRSPASSERVGMGFYVFGSRSTNRRGESGRQRYVDPDRQATSMSSPAAGRRTAATARHPGSLRHFPLRRSLGRLQPDPPRRSVCAVGRAARSDPPRPLHDGAGRARPDRRARRAPATCVGSLSSSAASRCPSTKSSSPATDRRSMVSTSTVERPLVQQRDRADHPRLPTADLEP